MTTWEVHDGAQQVGPLDEAAVLRMIAGGLPGTVMVRAAGESEWRGIRTHAPFAMALERRAAAPAPAAPVAPPASPTRTPKISRLWFVAAGVSVALVSIGIAVVSQAETGTCRRSIGYAEQAYDAKNWDWLRVVLPETKGLCDERRADELAAMEKGLRAHDEDEARVAAAKKAAEDAERDQAAVAAFPERASEVRSMVKSASAAIARKALDKAAPTVKSARDALSEFKGTTVEKGEEWRALAAQVGDLEQQVQPYVDSVNALLAEARKRAAEEATEDRAAGVKVTRSGYVASLSLGNVERAVKYAAANDKEGFTLFVRSTPGVFMTESGKRVVPLERSGLLSGYVHVRVRGTLVEFWTLKEALADP